MVQVASHSPGFAHRAVVAAITGAIAICAYGLATGAPANAQAMTQLRGEALRTAYAGQTHISVYRYYIEGYGDLEFVEVYSVDGTLTYQAGDVTATGRWRTENDRICFDYDGATLLSSCFAVFIEDGCFFSYMFGANGKPTGVAERKWWIRAHIEGTEPDCIHEGLVS